MNSNDQITRWCPEHLTEASPWRYEEELERELCPLCYTEYWEQQDKELWGE
jgi:hypothetical protein